MGQYDNLRYNHCGKSGLRIPEISLGLWHNFGTCDDYDNARSMVRCAFEGGITHFDLANNYGPEPGAAETTFGRILHTEFENHRDEMLISSKAGYTMWPGPYGDWGSRKSLVASCDQSLKRMRLDYVDVFYHHRPDPETPLEETASALDFLVRSGRALYVGISNYNAAQTVAMTAILRELKTPFVLHQFRYNILDRAAETGGLLETLERTGLGGIVFSPHAQGILSDRYLHGIPADSRASRNWFLKSDSITESVLEKVSKLNALAKRRGETLSQMAVSWLLARPGVSGVIVGASRSSQIEDVLAGVNRRTFGADELAEIDAVALSKVKYANS